MMLRLRTGLDTGSLGLQVSVRLRDSESSNYGKYRRLISTDMQSDVSNRAPTPHNACVHPHRRNLRFFTIATALCLAACATTRPEPQIITHEVLVKVPIPCLATADRDNLLAKLPGDIGPWLSDQRQREGVYLDRLSRYKTFADAVWAVLPACVAPPVATPRPNEVTP